MARARWLLPTLCLLLANAAACADDDPGEDEALLRASNYPLDTPGLLRLFRDRTPTSQLAARANALLKQCGSEEFDERERATEALADLGPAVRPLLRDAVRHRDPEVARRAADVLRQLDRPDDPACLEAAARLLARRRPAGAAAVLLAHLPFLDEPTLADELASTLSRIAVRDGRAEPALADALTDRHPLTRAVAAEALTRGGATAQRDGVRKLLDDADPEVRARVALALMDARDRAALPALVRLTGELAAERRYGVEAALYAVAGDKAPTPLLGEEDEARRKRRAAWEAWLQEHGATAELPRAEPGPRLLGHTLLTMLDLRPRGLAGRVAELDASGRTLWEISGLRYPVDAQVLGPDRVLIVEYTDRTVSERNRRGEVLWSKTLTSYALAARRLPNGRTFIVARNQILEVGRDGNETELVARPGDIAGAVRLANRQVVVVTTGGTCVCYDGAGRETRSFELGGGVLGAGCGFEVLPSGNILVPLYSAEKIVEFDPTGKQVWEAAARTPTSAQRLPNGNTLYASRLGRCVYEVAPNGDQVSEYRPDGRPLKVQRR